MSSDNNKPMSAERLAEIRHWYDHHYGYASTADLWVSELLAEIERLRAVESQQSQWISELLDEQPRYASKNARLTSENAALRQVVRVVAEADNSDSGVCYQLCDVRWYGGETDAETMEMRHDAPCVVEQARKLLASESEAQQQAKEHPWPRPMLRAVISRSCDMDKHEQCEIPEQCVCWCHRESEGE